MYFYEVLARSRTYHGTSYLTYSSSHKLKNGQLIMIELRSREVAGVIIKEVKRPAFNTKPINSAQPDLTPLPGAVIDLISWLINYYPGPLGLIAQLFLPTKLVEPKPKTDPDNKSLIKSLPLTTNQQSALKVIKNAGPGTFIVHGDTGSGKTRLYIEVAAETLTNGQSVMILVPEISLIPQMVSECQKHLSFPVMVLHSNLTEAEHRRTWFELLKTKRPVVVVGPRSALFSPISNLGLIVVDEFHEPAYKQQQVPYYQAVRVAAYLAHLHQAKLLLGSATPPVDDYYLAKAKGSKVIRLEGLATGKATKSTVSIVDLKQRDNFSKHPSLSSVLISSIAKALDRQEQSLVFLNRRGTARLVACKVCGWQALCPRCDVPLIYHGDKHQMLCHICGYHQSAPTLCPACGNSDIQFKAMGTKLLVIELQKLFPSAKVQRFDTDNLKAERFEEHFEKVKAGKVDILVGTQLLTKGLDLPNLSLVGAVLADSNLYFPDYTAEERTYQMLAQVAGRVGRGHRAGKVVIQTYRPDSPTIRAVAKKDWQSFYESQLVERLAFHFPPFFYMAKLSVERASAKEAENSASKLSNQLLSQKLPIILMGPGPAFQEKSANRYTWQLVIKAKSRKMLIDIVKKLPSGWHYDLDPDNLL